MALLAPARPAPTGEWRVHAFAQLEAAIEFLLRKIEEEPIEDLIEPRYPDKSLDY